MTNLRQRRALGAATPEKFNLSVATLSRSRVFSESLEGQPFTFQARLPAPEFMPFGLENLEGLEEDVTGLFEKNADQLLKLAVALEEQQGWHVRDQGGRSTCNAFAVVAAEELFEANRTFGAGSVPKTLPMKTFSEDFLYTAIVGEDLPIHAMGSAQKIAEDGSTFLEQAVKAVQNTGLYEGSPSDYHDSPRHARNYERPLSEATGPSTKTGGYVHEIDTSHASGSAISRPSRPFPISGRSVSSLFLEALNKGVPVVASFAIAEDPGDAAWFGHRARLDGHVLYPALEVSTDLGIQGGHTVCIVGYLRGARYGAGSFVFRNSYGPDIFGGAPYLNAKDDDFILPRGYGYISIDDVDRYCWEFMYKAS